MSNWFQDAWNFVSRPLSGRTDFDIAYRQIAPEHKKVLPGNHSLSENLQAIGTNPGKAGSEVAKAVSEALTGAPITQHDLYKETPLGRVTLGGMITSPFALALGAVTGEIGGLTTSLFGGDTSAGKGPDELTWADRARHYAAEHPGMTTLAILAAIGCPATLILAVSSLLKTGVNAAEMAAHDNPKNQTTTQPGRTTTTKRKPKKKAKHKAKKRKHPTRR